ncbi:hypothetical protein KHQ81_04635 [Mycoplasmatota bacterium]|nr:hypothetical protein KHQ81_04635 [Mycoplasmatota bacterium]
MDEEIKIEDFTHFYSIEINCQDKGFGFGPSFADNLERGIEYDIILNDVVLDEVDIIII